MFDQKRLEKLDPKNIPSHVAIIPDGNRRWAKTFISGINGHEMGASIVTDIVKAAKKLGVSALTIYTFSTENWKRPKIEVKSLLALLQKYLTNQEEKLVEAGVRLHTIGDLSPFPQKILKSLEKTKNATKEGTDIDFILALNYGGRQELVRVMKQIAKECQEGALEEKGITEKTISDRLDTAKWGDPQLFIRTSGEMRVSNFLLWQISYTELHMTDVLWPDFRPDHLLDALLDYQKRNHRGGA